MSRIFIIIVSYNGMAWLPKTFSLIPFKYTVILVDNNSSDETVQFIQKKYPQTKIISQKKNIGFGQANNAGISFALRNGADYVFLLNQDAFLNQDIIEKLINTHQRNNQFGILSPIHLNGKGDELDRNFSYYVDFNKNPNFYSDYVLNQEIKEIYEVPFINAAGWLLSRHCLETVGGFDPIFFHYGEDDNFCQRVRYHNLKVGVVPGTYINHDRNYNNEPRISRGSDAYFEKMARSAKIVFADINRENLSSLENVLKNRRKSRLKSYLKLNYRAVRFYNKEIMVLSSIIPEIKRSKEINKKERANYLDI